MNAYKSFKEVPHQETQPAKPVLNRQKIAIYQPRPKDPVVNSAIGYQPIDRVAARVVMPAKWYEQPPEPEPKIMKPEFSEPPQLKSKRMLDKETGKMEDMVDHMGAVKLAAVEHDRLIKKEMDQTEELLQRARDLIATVEYLAKEFRGPWSEHQEFVRQALEETRTQRIALGSETRLLMSALKDVRQFFLDQDYEQEIRRLHEFVDLCERLKALYEEGFVDAIADTILKLARIQ